MPGLCFRAIGPTCSSRPHFWGLMLITMMLADSEGVEEVAYVYVRAAAKEGMLGGE